MIYPTLLYPAYFSTHHYYSVYVFFFAQMGITNELGMYHDGCVLAGGKTLYQKFIGIA